MFPCHQAGECSADILDSDWSQSHGVFVRAGGRRNGFHINGIESAKRSSHHSLGVFYTKVTKSHT